MGIATGLSSWAIEGGGIDHPWDPSDLNRCMRYCDGRLTTEQLRTRMAGRSLAWDRLLPEWDNLTALLRHEMDTRTDGTAPLTYYEMKRVLADGVKCDNCNSTGRGATCVKCKGTGYRSGGRCRARNCARGAAPCPTCSGRGYTNKEND
ncbi:MAG: hypothetical protein ABWY57_15875 [Mycetocola sp.]